MQQFKLRNIIKEYLVELGEDQIDNRYPQFLQIAIAGLRKMNTHINGFKKVAQLEINENTDIALLPEDYIDYYKIFMVRGSQMFSLGLNENMQPALPDDCGTDNVPNYFNRANNSNNNDTDINGLFYSFTTHYDENGRNIGKYYGIKGGQNLVGEYRIWPQYGYMSIVRLTIDQGGVIDDRVYMEYLANPQIVDGDHTVHPFDVEALKAWMFWRYVQRKPQYAEGKIERARIDWMREKDEAKSMHSSINVNELLSAYRTGFQLAPKI